MTSGTDKCVPVTVKVSVPGETPGLDAEDAFYDALGALEHAARAITRVEEVQGELSVAHQGQAMDGYTMLAEYSDTAKRVYEALCTWASLGLCCRSGARDCWCALGWPPEKQCPKCRDRWKPGKFRDSRCICPPEGPVPEPSETEKLWSKMRRGDAEGVARHRTVKGGCCVEEEANDQGGQAKESYPSDEGI